MGHPKSLLPMFSLQALKDISFSLLCQRYLLKISKRSEISSIFDLKFSNIIRPLNFVLLGCKDNQKESKFPKPQRIKQKTLILILINDMTPAL
jgi:hypothetical protein